MSEMGVALARSSCVLGEEELNLFLEYIGLPADQLGRIFGALAGLNESILNAVRDVQWRQGDLDLRPELHIASVRTGESIDIKFREGKILPSLEFPNENLVLVLPKWTAVLIVSGEILLSGAAVLGAVDVFRQHLPRHQQIQVEQHVDLDQVTNPNSQVGRDVRLYLAAFNKEIDSPNILSVSVNGTIIRKREEGDAPPPNPPIAA